MAMTILSSVNFASSWQPSDSTLSILRLLKGKILVTVQELGEGGLFVQAKIKTQMNHH